MTNEEWLNQQIQMLKQQAATYEDQAFYEALAELNQALATRIEQRQGELDGRIWNATKW
ncbi:hypothetical protein ACEN4E_01560 [Latilactobacillus sakei]|uniref:hypothetical protein n=1 Tax=Latilactobacillus sakei TaxID=1599 RepID=UPI003889AC1F